MSAVQSAIVPLPPPRASVCARFVRDRLPPDGLFAGQSWRISPAPFPLGTELAKELESLGRVLLQFYRAVNLLYRRSAVGKQPEWIARLLDQGKPAGLLELQRAPQFKNIIPRVIRPDILLASDGFTITELDSVPGGIGLTAWLNQTYSESEIRNPETEILGGPDGMLRGFASIFGTAKQIHIVVSDEAATYRPEMKWLAERLGPRFAVRNSQFADFTGGDAIYRFFELFDLANVPNSKTIFELAAAGHVYLTPPPKPLFEEKLLFALLWNRNLHSFWRQELGESFFSRLRKLIPYTWVVDPAPMPPHAAIPGLDLTDWHQLKVLSQHDRDLILKVSGFSAHAWGARGVYLGSDLSQADWAAAVDNAITNFAKSPCVLQRYRKPKLVETHWFDFDHDQLVAMPGRVRLCPYYFVAGDGDSARATLGAVLATICAADKKIIHGMTDSIFAPCSV